MTSISGTTVVVAAVLVLCGSAASAQTTSPADAPWSGQAQCVLRSSGPNYQDEQTHTWRITGGPPRVAGSIQHWPAVWSVQGSGRRVVPSAGGRAAPPEERWTVSVPETSAPIAIAEVPGPSGKNRIRISSQHGLLVAKNAALPVRAVSGETIMPSLQEWQFPAAEDVITSTVISGTRTRTLPGGPAAWRKGPDVTTIETCTWQFTRAGASLPPGTTPPLSSTGIAGRRAATTTSPVTSQPGPTPTGGALIADPTRPMTVCVAGPAPLYSATPGGVTFTLSTRSGTTGYRIARRDLGDLTPSPITAQSYTHAAPLESQVTYEYVVTGMQSDGSCTTASVSVTPPKPVTPQVATRVTANGPTTRATLSWGVQPDRPTAYLVLGAGLPPEGVEVAASSMGHSLDTNNLLVGTHAWLVAPLWKTPAGTMIDVSAAARATATVGSAGAVVPDSIWNALTKTMQSYHDAQMAPLGGLR